MKLFADIDAAHLSLGRRRVGSSCAFTQIVGEDLASCLLAPLIVGFAREYESKSKIHVRVEPDSDVAKVAAKVDAQLEKLIESPRYRPLLRESQYGLSMELVVRDWRAIPIREETEDGRQRALSLSSISDLKGRSCVFVCDLSAIMTPLKGGSGPTPYAKVRAIVVQPDEPEPELDLDADIDIGVYAAAPAPAAAPAAAPAPPAKKRKRAKAQ